VGIVRTVHAQRGPILAPPAGGVSRRQVLVAIAVRLFEEADRG
jgi:hypothetical protein